MLDSGASHNLMPKSVKEKLNLGITRPYKDLFPFESIQIKCLGLIKDLCVSLVQYPAKTILMDIVVADIPPKYGMLLSRSWGAKLQGILQIDMSYATILVFRQPKKLYRETLIKYVVSSRDRPQNFPIYSLHSDIDYFILYNVEQTQQTTSNNLISETKEIAATAKKETILTQEISNKQDNQNAPNNENFLPPDSENSEHEILWHLEFDGLVNK